MSTRAQIIITDGHDDLWFYRHSDGYPEGTMPTLEKFLDYVKQGKIRDNTEQAAGWLVLIGAQEYDQIYDFEKQIKGKLGELKYHKKTMKEFFEPQGGMSGWKCGAYEPCLPEEHGDIEYLYEVNLKTKTITYKER